MTILDSLIAEPAPLRFDEGGALRVGQTRVRLDSVLAAFNSGNCPEEILLKYPSLELAQIYSVIAYYLWHRAEIDAYLSERQAVAEQSAQEIAERFPNEGIRQRLSSRRRIRMSADDLS